MLAASLNGALGRAGLLITLVASTFGMFGMFVAARRGDRRLAAQMPRYAWLAFGGAVLAVVMMLRALITRDFSLAYVQQVGSTTTPWLYNVAALWSALEGSILLWLLVLTGYGAVVAWQYRHRSDDLLVGWAFVVIFFVTAFFALLSFGPADAFANGPPGGRPMARAPTPCCRTTSWCCSTRRSCTSATSGSRSRSRSRSPRSITGRVGEGWLSETRRWTLFSWAFLTLGILLGGWWSYEVLGWGGVWAWDPVENASFLPWLTGTAYLHSVLVQERRGMLRVWNLSLLIATFSLTILGTYLTRSGLLNSVHAFGDGPVGNYLLAFFGIVMIVSLALIGWRGDRLRSPGGHRLAPVA